jgi:hypothetical protein
MDARCCTGTIAELELDVMGQQQQQQQQQVLVGCSNIEIVSRENRRRLCSG